MMENKFISEKENVYNIIYYYYYYYYYDYIL